MPQAALHQVTRFTDPQGLHIIGQELGGEPRPELDAAGMPSRKLTGNELPRWPQIGNPPATPTSIAASRVQENARPIPDRTINPIRGPCQFIDKLDEHDRPIDWVWTTNLRGQTVQARPGRQPILLTCNETLDTVLDTLVTSMHEGAVVIDDDGHLLGIATFDQVTQHVRDINAAAARVRLAKEAQAAADDPDDDDADGAAGEPGEPQVISDGDSAEVSQ